MNSDMIKSLSIKAPNFDIKSHMSPNYNIFGYETQKHKDLKKGEVLFENVKILGNEARRGMRMEDVIKKRKQEYIPDPSYDLNNDGIISPKEYLIAKIFDEDKDGKLNAEEREKCISALKQGFESTLYWSEEKNDPNFGLRAVQKAGKIFLSDSLHNQKTNNIDRTNNTKTYLDQMRKTQRVNEGNTMFNTWHNQFMRSLTLK